MSNSLKTGILLVNTGSPDAPEITEAIADKAREAGFEVAGQTIEIAGLCPDCRGEGAADGA